MNHQKQLECFPAMEQWNPTFRSGHIPMWYKKLLTIRNRRRHPNSICNHHAELQGPLWDHWGSVVIKGKQVLITQPYCDETKLAQAEADSLGCNLSPTVKGGPWHPGTWLFQFNQSV